MHKIEALPLLNLIEVSLLNTKSCSFDLRCLCKVLRHAAASALMERNDVQLFLKRCTKSIGMLC